MLVVVVLLGVGVLVYELYMKADVVAARRVGLEGVAAGDEVVFAMGGEQVEIAVPKGEGAILGRLRLLSRMVILGRRCLSVMGRWKRCGLRM